MRCLACETKAHSTSFGTLVNKHDWVGALELLVEAKGRVVETNRLAFSGATSTCGRSEQWDRAVGLLGAARWGGLEVNVITCSAAASACEKSGRWGGAALLLSGLAGTGLLLDPIVCGSAVSACGKSQLWRRAVDLFQAVPRAREVACGAVVTACERSRQWTRALTLLSDLRSAGSHPSVVAYSAAISACDRCERWEHALALLAEMQATEVRPNAITFNAVVSACDKGEQWQRAVSVVAAMQASRVAPDEVTYGALISACGKGYEWARSLWMLSQMRRTELPLGVVTYGAAISACAQSGQWERGLVLLRQMQRSSIEPNAIAYSAAWSACEGGEWRLQRTRLRSAGPPVVEPCRLDQSRPLVGGEGRCNLHFCIFQGDEFGLDSWSLEAGGKQHRWDTLLDGLAPGLATDARASLFVGGDAVHLCPQTMLAGTPGFSSWVEDLWRTRAGGVGVFLAPASVAVARARLLDHLDEMLVSAPKNSLALAFAMGCVGPTYGQLRALGAGRAASADCVFVLLGGAHGFDGCDDVVGDGAFFEEVVGRFSIHLGERRVARVDLCEGVPAKFPLSKVAAFVAAEHVRGALRRVAAGLEEHGKAVASREAALACRAPHGFAMEKQFQQGLHSYN